jgi:hypothetical protein
MYAHIAHIEELLKPEEVSGMPMDAYVSPWKAN